jgi:Zn-dependent protease
MSLNSPTEIVVFAICAIVAITFHEAAHGFVALHFGDSTAKNAGRVTLNPIKHIDLFGTIILPLLLFVSAGFIFGYAKPVPVNYSALRNPRWDMVWVAAAGPAMNVMLALASVILITGIGVLDGENAALIGNALLLSIELNLILAIFNMLPLPPLDGSKVIAAFLPESLIGPYLRFGRYGMAVLLLLVFVAPILAARAGMRFDIFGWLVIGPADALMHALLSLIGRG